MALEEYVGAIILELDGREIEIQSLSPRINTGRRPVKTMNRKGKTSGFTRGTRSYDLSVTAVIPITGEPVDWENIEGAKITIQPTGGGKRTSYLDCFTVDVGESYTVDGGEAHQNISMVACDKITE
jgi:hypothetical protein